jgi:hypothetical protein
LDSDHEITDIVGFPLAAGQKAADPQRSVVSGTFRPVAGQ